jgi:hypothetical protein
MQTAFAITDEYSRAFEQRDSSDPRSRDDTLDDDRDTPRAISNEEVFGRNGLRAWNSIIGECVDRRIPSDEFLATPNGSALMRHRACKPERAISSLFAS